MLAGYDNKSSFQSVASIMSGRQEGITVFADSAFNFPWNTHPVPHGNITYKLNVTPAALRVFRDFGFCKFK